MKTKNYISLLFVCLCLCQSYAYSQCTTASYGQFPSSNFTNAACDGVAQEISPSCFAGEFSAVNVTYGNTYVFSSSVPTDYLTITSLVGDGVIDFGLGSVTYQAEYTGLVYFYTHTDNVCGESGVNRSRYASCAAPSGCMNAATFGGYPVDVFTNTICTGLTSEIIADNCYAGEYSRVAVELGKTYTFSSSVATDYVTISDELGTTVYEHGDSPVTYQATSTGVVRFYLHTNVLCQEENVSRSRIVRCIPQMTCNNGDLYPLTDYTPVCDATEYVIANNAFAGEYSNIVMVAGTTYWMKSSVVTDYITITSADGNTVHAQHYNGLQFTAPTSGTYRFYIHKDIFCGTEPVNRTRSILCSGTADLKELSETEVEIYPNPTANQFTISADEQMEEIQILSIDGKLLLTAKPTNLSTTLSLESFQSGTYFVRATIRGRVVTKEVIKQ